MRGVYNYPVDFKTTKFPLQRSREWRDLTGFIMVAGKTALVSTALRSHWAKRLTMLTSVRLASTRRRGIRYDAGLLQPTRPRKKTKIKFATSCNGRSVLFVTRGLTARTVTSYELTGHISGKFGLEQCWWGRVRLIDLADFNKIAIYSAGFKT